MYWNWYLFVPACVSQLCAPLPCSMVSDITWWLGVGPGRSIYSMETGKRYRSDQGSTTSWLCNIYQHTTALAVTVGWGPAILEAYI